MNWSTFFQSLGKFFSGIAQTFLANVMAAIPQAEQDVINILTVIVDAVIAGIENGTIPLPVLAKEGDVDPLALGKLKHDVAFAEVQKRLASNPPTTSVPITTSLINWTIENSVQKYKVNNSGNHGNFPGGNSNA